MTLLWERISWLGGVCAALILGALWMKHLGYQECVNKAELAAAIRHTAVVGQQIEAAQLEIARLNLYATKMDVPVTNAPVIRVCAFPSGGVLLPGSAEAGANGTPAVPREAAPSYRDWDTTPILTLGRDADAQIEYLQGYIKDTLRVYSRGKNSNSPREQPPP